MTTCGAAAADAYGTSENTKPVTEPAATIAREGRCRREDGHQDHAATVPAAVKGPVCSADMGDGRRCALPANHTSHRYWLPLNKDWGERTYGVIWSDRD